MARGRYRAAARPAASGKSALSAAVGRRLELSGPEQRGTTLRSPNGLLRTRGDAAAGRVAFVELFYDLVFVFAITQLSHLLLHHYTLRGAVETACCCSRSGGSGSTRPGR